MNPIVSLSDHSGLALRYDSKSEGGECMKEETCCPEFKPTSWDGKTLEWKDKRFIKDKVFTREVKGAALDTGHWLSILSRVKGCPLKQSFCAAEQILVTAVIRNNLFQMNRLYKFSS